MPNVIVVGSINMDIVVRASRHPLPGETVPGFDLRFYPGGKGANQAVAAARAGARTSIIGRLGDDPFAPELRQFLDSQGVDTSYVPQASGPPSGTALIVVSEQGENTIVVVPGANALTSAGDVDSVAMSKGDIVLCQCEVPIATVCSAFEGARRAGATTIYNPAPASADSRNALTLADIVVVNETELATLLEEPGIQSESAAVMAAARRLRLFDDQVVIVTLGAKGVVAVVGDRDLRAEGHDVNVVDTTGAGDCFVGSMAACFARGATLDHAIRYANAAASICVQRAGAGPSMPTDNEVRATLA